MTSKFLRLIYFTSFLCLSGIDMSAEDAAHREPLALINGEPITAEEIEKPLGAQLSKLEEQIYALKRQKLEALIQTRLLAKEAAKRGLNIPALLEAEVASKVSPVTEQEIETYYQANKAKYAEDNYRQVIQSQLQNQRRSVQHQAFIESLRSQANVVINLKQPPIYRADISAAGAPIRGSVNASVTIVEFSDFHCPYCKQVQPTLTRILSDYGDRVRLAYRDLPLDRLHPSARRAAEAARCANDQNKFWEYHDQLYAVGTDVSSRKLSALAQEAGMDISAFNECLTTGRHRSKVDQDVEQATDLGVHGTPHFFINGRPLSGAQPYEVFASMINEELEFSRRKSTRPSAP